MSNKSLGEIPVVKPESRYKADITGGSLKLQESRVVAGLLLDGVTDTEWKDAHAVYSLFYQPLGTPPFPGCPQSRLQAVLVMAPLNPALLNWAH
ncbi:MAG: DUF1819 family protein [Rhodospirillaceae bacterium]|nr:DUF1819 family protein [Rhodospirillaceae bacterium]